ncbi:MAG: lytic transglycosylase domain-containing protein [Limibacillus sp.]
MNLTAATCLELALRRAATLAAGLLIALLCALPAIKETRALEVAGPLSAADAALYRDIFSLQEQGRWKEADRKIDALQDPLLLGHLQFQRYMHPTAYRSRYRELAAWLERYGDHPGAERIYRLAEKRRPAGAATPRPRRAAELPLQSRSLDRTKPYIAPGRSSAERREAGRILAQVRRNVLRDRLTATENWLKTGEVTRGLDQVEQDVAAGLVAGRWYYLGRDQRAFDLAAPGAQRSGGLAPYNEWIAGLAAWRLDRLEDSFGYFSALAESERASPWTRTAAAYWAARAALRLERPQVMSGFLRLAAKEPFTFYGLLARHALGIEVLPEELRQPDASELSLTASTPAERRALALLQIGERGRAEAELLVAGGWEDEAGARRLLAIADAAGMPNLSYRLAWQLINLGVEPEDPQVVAGLFPLPHWKPESGFQVDRALIFAFVRQESRFDPNARSRSGARGLMQILPSTASYVSGDAGYRSGRLRFLYLPEVNLDLGQRYILYLLGQGAVNKDLFKLATAYNGGPGNLAKWQADMDHRDDPLLFIESLPSRETRFFAERILANLWIYRARLGQKAPSLAALAGGTWPTYLSLDSFSQEARQYGAH